jgi:hypothetical protein
MQVTIELLLKGRWKWWKRHQIKNLFMNSYMIYTENKKTIVTRTGDIILVFTLPELPTVEGQRPIRLCKLILRTHFDRYIYKMLVTVKPDEQKKEEG